MKSSVLAYLSAFAMLGASDAFRREGRQEVPKDDSNRKKLYKPSKQGQQVFPILMDLVALRSIKIVLTRSITGG